jgi:fructokinase
MRKIYTIGETVLDIVFKDQHPVTAKAGGACLNSAVTLGRLNLPVYFVGEYGMDEVGNIIDAFLKKKPGFHTVRLPVLRWEINTCTGFPE